jgi:hypothetical protein
VEQVILVEPVVLSLVEQVAQRPEDGLLAHRLREQRFRIFEPFVRPCHEIVHLAGQFELADDLVFD